MKNNLYKKILYVGSFIFMIFMPLYSSYITDVLYDANLNVQFENFSTHVLRMQSPVEWSALVQDVKQALPGKPTHMELYGQIKKSYIPMQPRLYAYRLYQALKYQQDLLGNQVKNLIATDTKVNGYVEIGTPCRYADYIGQHIAISGTRYAVCEKTSFADVFESKNLHITRGCVPYDRYIPLNDYNPIAYDHILDASVDMVVCFIGLHHIPLDKIDNFIGSIARILRPGGTFLLRDHDACNADVLKIAHAGHTLFNAIIGQCSEEEEAQEIRNFQPLAYWVELLEKHGLSVGQERIMQQNDPTHNTMIASSKPILPHDRILLDLQKELGYKRHTLQTFLTAPEWFNVDSAQSYGAFLDHSPWYDFPFLKNIEIYWYIFGQSFKQARATNSLYEILIENDYFWTCMVIGVFMTTEYTIKAMLGSVVQFLNAGTYDETITITVQGLSDKFLSNLSNRIIILEKIDDITVLKVARYETFQKVIALLSDDEGKIIEIAGQKIIQVKVKALDQILPEDSWTDLQSCAEQHGVTLSYTWRIPTELATYGSLLVPIERLQNLVSDNQLHNISILYVHDF